MSKLRLSMGGRPGRDRLDGGWWPRSRDLTTELTHLVGDFPPELCLLVVPPGFGPAQGEEALLASSTRGNRHAARDLL